MKAYLSDIHDSHGITFSLELQREERIDDNFDRLQKMLNSSRSLCLYSYSIRSGMKMLVIKLTEGLTHLALVNGRYNNDREDQRFMVIIDEGARENFVDAGKGIASNPYYKCHCCGIEVWGVNRTTMEVYDEKSKSIKAVSVHDKCKLERLREIETMYAET